MIVFSHDVSSSVAPLANIYIDAAATTGNYHARVGAFALYGDINSGPFTLGVRYTTAVQRFNVLDLPQKGKASLTGGTLSTVTPGNGIPLANATGAKPWTAGLQGGYNFEAWCRKQNVYLGYQTSREAAGLNLPKNRYLIGYDITAWKNTNFGIEWDHDNAYNVANGGTGKNTNLVSLRAAVKFS